MVRHQAVRKQVDAVAAGGELQDLEEALAVGRVCEDRPSLVAAGDDLVHAVLDLDPRQP